MLLLEPDGKKTEHQRYGKKREATAAHGRAGDPARASGDQAVEEEGRREHHDGGFAEHGDQK